MQKKLIQINDVAYRFTETLTMEDILLYFGFNIDIILVNYNGSLIRKSLFRKLVMQNGDSVEIITIAGGG